MDIFSKSKDKKKSGAEFRQERKRKLLESVASKHSKTMNDFFSSKLNKHEAIGIES